MQRISYLLTDGQLFRITTKHDLDLLREIETSFLIAVAGMFVFSGRLVNVMMAEVTQSHE